ncbi:hypothetical protein SO802_019121 [Lithocarpus litseifolius]|uniref:Uncharacterized protein n=1 Tax=Lithocarpus litseifolius TaxID=425828 RepID=A0AAW2CNB0_9ROSI
MSGDRETTSEQSSSVHEGTGYNKVYSSEREPSAHSPVDEEEDYDRDASRKKTLRLVSDMPNSNRNWKGRYFFVQGTNCVCRLEEWMTMSHGFDNTWGIVKDSGLVPDLITLDTLHAYCGGPVSTLVARRLNTYSHRQMEATRQKALVKASVAARKQKEKEMASTSSPKVIGKGSSKRKNEGKDDRPLKKGPVIPEQYKGTLCTLNKEVVALIEKLKEEARLQEKAQEAKANLETKLTTLCEQVRSVYPNLDLSKVTMDNPLSTTPANGDIASEETNDFTHTEQGSKDDSVVLAQPSQGRPVTPLILFAENPPLKDARNPSTQDAQNPTTKDDENPTAQDTQILLA